jgi:hypothetical protein
LLQRLGDGLIESFGGAGLGRAEQLFELGPGLFDGVQVGANPDLTLAEIQSKLASEARVQLSRGRVWYLC